MVFVTYKISTKLHLICLICSMSMYYLFYNFVNVAVEGMFNSSVMCYPTPNLTTNFILISLTIVSAMSIIHELIHKYFYELFGGKAKIGFKYIYAYTQETSKIAIRTWKFIIILLMPLVVISVCTLPFNYWLTDFIFFFNLVGATGDIIMTLIVLRYGKNGRVIDEDKGFSIKYDN